MVEPSTAGVKGTVVIVEPSRAERTIARRSAETRATVPDLELGVEVDMSASMSLVVDGPDPITPLLVRACALALREFPRANSAYRDGHFELYSRINVGVVLDSEDEQITATVFDADRKGLAELAEELASLRGRAAELTPPERSGATFTISYPGLHGVTRAAPVISSPQAAALAAGEPRDAAVVRDGVIVPGHVMDLSLACDHRILYGTQAAAFLVRVKRLLDQADL